MWKKIRIAWVCVFLLAAFVIPVWALMVPAHQTRTDFTWDMFAERRDCVGQSEDRPACTVYYAIGDGELQRISWGRRPGAEPSDIEAGECRTHQDCSDGFMCVPPGVCRYCECESDEQCAEGYFCNRGNGMCVEVYDADTDQIFTIESSGPYLNLRAPPQIARFRSQSRMQILADEFCGDLETLFEAALNDELDESTPPWVIAQARRWERADRDLRFYSDCACRYNNRPTCEDDSDCGDGVCITVVEADEDAERDEVRVCHALVGDIEVNLCGGDQ